MAETAAGFLRRFEENLAGCSWQPHPLYSVFTQYDQGYYLAQREAFLHKYRCFWAVSRTIEPRRMIELGTCAGSSADAYLSACPEADYLGIDWFGVSPRRDDGSPWDPYAVAGALLRDRGFPSWRLQRADLRSLTELPGKADWVVIDAAHDFANEYADLQLALTADPEILFIDDAADPGQAGPAIAKFLAEDLAGRVRFTVPIPYLGGGLVVRLR